MEPKLVTLAIITNERSQKIVEVLVSHGIETVIDKLHIDDSEVAVGVRIRVKEIDVPNALELLEDVEIEREDILCEAVDKGLKQVLIPIDFADEVRNLIDYGFMFANKLGAKVIFMIIYYNPTFSTFYGKGLETYDFHQSDSIRSSDNTRISDVENLTSQINSLIERGELPNCPFDFELKVGIPEDEIIAYCKKNKPELVVMATREKNIPKTAEEQSVIKVTAAVMESSVSPVLGIPLELKLKKWDELKRIALFTDFNQDDLVVIDRILSLLRHDELELFCIHAYNKYENLTELMIDGITTYFEQHYPGLKLNYALVEAMEDLELLNDLLINSGINMLSFNVQKQRVDAFSFNLSVVLKIISHSDIPILVGSV